MKREPVSLVVAVMLLLGGLGAAVAEAAGDEGFGPLGRDFVRRSGRGLALHGRPLRVAGASNYYLMYKSPAMVDDLLNTASASGFNVIRMWGSLDIGNQDGSDSISGKADGVYFHYWDGTAPAFNDGPDGLEHLDYVLYKARQLGLKVIIPFVNNWNDFGGMDQYVRWRGGQYHDEFYTDPAIRGWYKEWIAHLLNRRNIYTGTKYKHDPTVLAWELANEPRCRAYGVYPESGACTTQTLIDWADEMSRFVKRIDRGHLLSAGDEGFYCIPGATDWTENCGEGVDTLALADLPAMDAMSFHLYPDSWGKDAAWGTQWIRRHIRDGRRIHEKVLLGEFGFLDKATRNPVYKEWTDTILDSGGAGALYWILSDKQDDGSPYPDYDGFTVYCPSPVCTAFSNFAKQMLFHLPFRFPPVADHDRATTEFDTAVTLPATANDVTYFGAALRPGTLDLDPATRGQQTDLTTPSGVFTLETGGSVRFTPTPGFSGQAVAPYVVKDSRGRTSNPADLMVTVNPDPDAALMLFSFETGTEGWGPASWQTNAGTVAESSLFPTHGSSSLAVSTADGGWFGLSLPAPANIAAKTHLKMEISTLSAGTSQNVALQLGDGWTWCEGAWGWINPGTTAAPVDVTLSSLNCGGTVPDFTKVQAMYVFFSGTGGTDSFYLDAVRAE
jgi:mannan endo-1,4-beta-mannosidase